MFTPSSVQCSTNVFFGVGQQLDGQTNIAPSGVYNAGEQHFDATQKYLVGAQRYENF